MYEAPMPAPLREEHTVMQPLNLSQRLEMLQANDVVEAFSVPQFREADVCVTLAKKEGRGDQLGEDAFIADPETGLLGVLDGVGGRAAGAQASRAAAQELPGAFKKRLDETEKETHEGLERRLAEYLGHGFDFHTPEQKAWAQAKLQEQVQALLKTNETLAERTLALLESITDLNPVVAETGGQTTICAGFLHNMPNGKQYAVVANLGDSGAMIRNTKTGEMRAITKPDTLISYLIQKNQLTKKTLDDMRHEPDKEFALPIVGKINYYKLRVMTFGGLGQDSKPYAGLEIVELNPDEEVVFATDGILDMVEDKNGNTDFTGIARAAQSETTQAKQLDAMRVWASRQDVLHKNNDDKAMVSARARASVMVS